MSIRHCHFFSTGFAYYSTESGFIEEQLFDDINADGLPEWVLAFGGIGANQLNSGWLYVLQWQDGHLVDLAPDAPYGDPNGMRYESPAGGGGFPLFPYGVEVHYEDVGENGTREIIINQLQDDNWGCVWHMQRVFAWDGKGYSLASNERTYDDVQGCEIRTAEEAMWVQDFETAIEHFERGLDLQPTEQYFFGDPQEITRYATARLALAYTLTERDREAARTINSLVSREEDSPTLVNFIAAIRTNLGVSMAMCQAAHDVFDFHCRSGTDQCLGSPMNAVVGGTDENSGYGVHSPGQVFPSPSAAGCDLAVPVQNQLNQMPLQPRDPLTAQLEAAGFKVLHALNFDLNQDGVDEWLIWLNMPVPALFFYADPSDEHYAFNYSNIPYKMGFDSPYAHETANPFFDSEISYSVRTLPDGQKTLIAKLKRRFYGYGYSCPPRKTEEGIAAGSPRFQLAFWRLVDGQLEFKQEIPFCEDVDLKTIIGDENQALPTAITAWAPLQDSSGDVVSATYTWDMEQRIYVATQLRPTAPPNNYDSSPFDAYGKAVVAIQQREFEAAKEILEEGLSNSDLSETERYLLRYLHALTFEALERPDEALLEYAAIYEAAPESAWGILAGLHIGR